ncbi:MAG TPA: DNA-processing protein DprA [Patescibacteria group bacterium]|nr:DNA-processing protein DprA [Patescibacteria group bacterium]
MGTLLNIVTSSPKSETYPSLLHTIPDFPELIYHQGVPLLSSDRVIAVVGTRNMTAYGAMVTRTLTKGLVERGWAILSGLAFGVDAESHTTALRCGGKTAAVLPGGLLCIAPHTHTQLAQRILNSGGVLYSEYEPNVEPRKHHFFARNRLIAGMSAAVLVTEAGSRSGTSITVSRAAEYGRPVFAVPGPITNPYSEGTKAFINMGATLVTSAEDLLTYIDEGKSRLVRQQLLFESEIERQIFEYVQHVGGASIEQLIQQLHERPERVIRALTSLEIRGLIHRSFGRYLTA